MTYMLFESVVTNIVCYGCAFDSVVSFVAYEYLLKKEKINILDVE